MSTKPSRLEAARYCLAAALLALALGGCGTPGHTPDPGWIDMGSLPVAASPITYSWDAGIMLLPTESGAAADWSTDGSEFTITCASDPVAPGTTCTVLENITVHCKPKLPPGCEAVLSVRSGDAPWTTMFGATFTLETP